MVLFFHISNCTGNIIESKLMKLINQPTGKSSKFFVWEVLEMKGLWILLRLYRIAHPLKWPQSWEQFNQYCIAICDVFRPYLRQKSPFASQKLLHIFQFGASNCISETIHRTEMADHLLERVQNKHYENPSFGVLKQ